jgi:hypothetical protein
MPLDLNKPRPDHTSHPLEQTIFFGALKFDNKARIKRYKKRGYLGSYIKPL